MKTWKGYNFLDLILISLGMIVVLTTGIVFHSQWFVIINTLLALLFVFTQAKAKIATLFFGVAHFTFYIFICYTQSYFGEALCYLVVMLPIYIYGIIHWLANKDKKNNVVLVRNNLSKKEWLITIPSFIAISICIFFILKALNTSQLVINFMAFISMLPAVYLLSRRCKWNHLAFLFNDFIVASLWLTLVLYGNLAFIPMCIYHVFQIIYDIYGITQWFQLERKQKQELQND